MANQKFDVIVIGGGPAGMIAAGRAAELGAKVLLLEKNPKLGKKLLITGGGRCNITNAETDIRKMIARYGTKGKALFGAFTRFGVLQSMEFFENHNLPLKVEAEKRTFPVSNKAEDVWKTLVNYMKEGKVEVRISSSITGFTHSEGAVTSVLIGKKSVAANNYIVATGGKSRPETGSTGEVFKYIQALGHTVEESDPALVPVTIHDNWVKELSGISFSAAKLTVFQDGKKQDSRVGKMLFTHFGISGPLVLNMSKGIAELFKYAPVHLELDLYPTMDFPALDKHVLQVFTQGLNKKIRNNMGGIVPPKMIPTVLEKTGIDPEKEINTVTKEERMKVVKFLKAMPMSVSGFLGVEKAIVTSGGVSLKEVDFKTMRSKLFSNLFFAGDVLDFDRPSGGFSLQICWTTGYLAGENSASASME